jgi:hypothetical protein
MIRLSKFIEDNKECPRCKVISDSKRFVGCTGGSSRLYCINCAKYISTLYHIGTLTDLFKEVK